MSFSAIAYIIATFCAFICLVLVVASEPDFLGLDALGWGLVSLFPFYLAHWLGGHTDALFVRRP